MANLCSFDGIIYGPTEDIDNFWTVLNNSYGYSIRPEALKEVAGEIQDMLGGITFTTDMLPRVSVDDRDAMAKHIKQKFMAYQEEGTIRILTPKRAKDIADYYINWLKTGDRYQDRPEEGHFYRVWDIYQDQREDNDNGYSRLSFGGSCAWSLSSAFDEEGYHRDTRHIINHTGLSIQEWIRERPYVKLEMISTETGLEFSERLWAEEGEAYIDCEDYSERWINDREEFIEVAEENDLDIDQLGYENENYPDFIITTIPEWFDGIVPLVDCYPDPLFNI